MILSKERDPRLITVRRGGTLTDEHHHLLAVWAAQCARHVLGLFEQARPDDDRPRLAIDAAHAWVRGEMKMMQARDAAGAAQDAAREAGAASLAAKYAALSAGQAAVVAHVAAHELGAAAYAIRATREAAPKAECDRAGRMECLWQREQLPEAIKELVLEDERTRNELCWFAFEG